jgi:hypothetical protein
MQFIGQQEETLVFIRVREMLPPEQLSPDRSYTMRLDPRRVAAITVGGRRVWPAWPA